MEADGDFCAVGEAGAPVAPFFDAVDAGVAGEAFAVDGWCGADEADPGVSADAGAAFDGCLAVFRGLGGGHGCSFCEGDGGV